jgi:rRNA biogenesis protein RRP5
VGLCLGDVEHARRLFERAVHVKQSTKKVKFLFKKFLAFEMERGTPETVEHVRNAARAYVESLAT